MHFGKAAAQAVMLGLQDGLQLVRGQGIGLRPGIMLAAARQKGGGTRRYRVSRWVWAAALASPAAVEAFEASAAALARCLRSFVAGGFGDIAGGGGCRCWVVQSTAHRQGVPSTRSCARIPAQAAFRARCISALECWAASACCCFCRYSSAVRCQLACAVCRRGISSNELAVLLLALGQLNGFAAAFQLGVRFAAGRDLRFQLG